MQPVQPAAEEAAAGHGADKSVDSLGSLNIEPPDLTQYLSLVEVRKQGAVSSVVVFTMMTVMVNVDSLLQMDLSPQDSVMVTRWMFLRKTQDLSRFLNDTGQTLSSGYRHHLVIVLLEWFETKSEWCDVKAQVVGCVVGWDLSYIFRRKTREG